MMKAMAVLLAAAIALGGAAQAAPVTIETGQLQGSDDGTVRAFLGVPYAAPPVGDLRWRPPQPAARWPGVRDATRTGASCRQVLSSPTQLSPIGRTAEDCLFLNIWTPAARGDRRPVMVWLHGGGFIAGSGSERQFDGHALARRGAILVTINYRLGRLGFFAHPALAAEQPGEMRGNYGLMDQVAALRWVRRNIAAFGGDPDNVTLFGQSAGGISTLLLLASGEARGLFHKAIVLSGTALRPPRDIAADRPNEPSAQTLGAAWASRVTGVHEPTAAMLRALPVERVAPPAPGLPEVMDILAAAGPMIDGQLMRENPWRSLARNGVTMPVIVGGTTRDAQVWSFASGGVQTLPFWTPKPEQIAVDPAKRAAIAAAYVREEGNQAAGDAALASDALFGAGAYRLAGIAARERPAWLYRFDAVPAPLRAFTDGAPHGTELFYAFGTLDRLPWRPADIDEQDRALSSFLLDGFVAFARTSNPGADWPRFDPAAPRQLVIEQSGPKAMPVDRKDQLEAIIAAAE